MTLSQEAIWTLDELCAEAALALAQAEAGGYAGQSSGRVREVPDARTVRYYTTLGLVDRPTTVRGRTGWYGVRQLLQLVAIKQLQARGASLAQIQAELMGQTNDTLLQWARIPASWLQERQQGRQEKGRPEAGGEETPRRDAFWTATGAPAEQIPLLGVPLDEGVTLLFAAARPVDARDREALQVAAKPLLRLLRTRRLLMAGHQEGGREPKTGTESGDRVRTAENEQEGKG